MKEIGKIADSKTSDVSRISVHDDRLTVRINSELKEAFVGHCRAKGLSCCHILEGLIYGYLKGFYDKFELDVKSPTINLTLVRDVKRVRRYAVEDAQGEVIESDRCCFCGKVAANSFEYMPTRREYALCDFHTKEHVFPGGKWKAVSRRNSVESERLEAKQ